MRDVLELAGQYWWLVFPVAGVVGGWSRRIAKYSERRRRDKIELARIRAGERNEQLRLSTASRAQIRKAVEAHDHVDERWFGYEMNLATIIDYPLMTDLRDPLTMAFHRAKIAADELRPTDLGELSDINVFTEYRDAVQEYAATFDAAEREARRRKQSAFSPVEREQLERARRLVMIAMNDAATPAERQSAYRRARAELDGLIVIPDRAIAELNRSVAGALES